MAESTYMEVGWSTDLPVKVMYPQPGWKLDWKAIEVVGWYQSYYLYVIWITVYLLSRLFCKAFFTRYVKCWNTVYVQEGNMQKISIQLILLVWKVTWLSHSLRWFQRCGVVLDLRLHRLKSRCVSVIWLRFSCIPPLNSCSSWLWLLFYHICHICVYCVIM